LFPLYLRRFARAFLHILWEGEIKRVLKLKTAFRRHGFFFRKIFSCEEWFSNENNEISEEKQNTANKHNVDYLVALNVGSAGLHPTGVKVKAT